MCSESANPDGGTIDRMKRDRAGCRRALRRQRFQTQTSTESHFDACRRVRTFAQVHYPHSAAQIVFKSGSVSRTDLTFLVRGQREKGFQSVERKPFSVAAESARSGNQRRHPRVWALDLVTVTGRRSPSLFHGDRAGRSTASHVPQRMPRFVPGGEWTLTVRQRRARQRKSHRGCFRMTAR